MSRVSSTRVSLVLTDWPPGPLERENRHCSSDSGTTTSSRICNGPGMARAYARQAAALGEEVSASGSGQRRCLRGVR